MSSQQSIILVKEESTSERVFILLLERGEPCKEIEERNLIDEDLLAP